MATHGYSQQKLTSVILTLFAGVLSAGFVASADTQGPLFPANVVVGAFPGGPAPWSNPNSVQASDDVDAIASVLASGGFTQSISVRDFGFSIPPFSVIDSVEIIVEGREVEGQSTFSTVEARLIRVGVLSSLSGTVVVPVSSLDSNTSIGPSLFGETYSGSDINASGFGATMNFGSDFNSTFEIDSIQLVVNFTPLAPITVSHFALAEEGQIFTASTTSGQASYQWFKDGSPMSDGGSISGTNTNTLTINTLLIADSGTYHATFDDGSPQNTASRSITVFAAGSLPVGGIIGIGISGAALALGGAMRIRRRKK